MAGMLKSFFGILFGVGFMFMGCALAFLLGSNEGNFSPLLAATGLPSFVFGLVILVFVSKRITQWT